MNFLAPLFLAGAAAVALPVLFHLIRRSTRDRTLFSSLLLLQPTPPRMRRRSRLEDILLLVLRCLVLGLLALGFARPFLKDPSLTPPAATAAQRVVMLVDTSASMRRGGLWEAAVERATQAAGSLGPGDHLSVFAFDRETRPLVSFDAWNSTPAGERAGLVASALRATSPGWASTQLANALIFAAESLAERAEDHASVVRRIILLSDLQEGSRLDPLQAYDWPKGITVQTLPLEPTRRSGNASLQWLEDPESAPATAPRGVRVRITTTADLVADKLEVGWVPAGSETFTKPPQELRLAAGANQVVVLPAAAGDTAHRLVLRGDGEPFDNTLHVVPPRPLGTRILCLSADPGTDPTQPLYFLRRVFPTNPPAVVPLVIRSPDAVPGPADITGALIVATSGLPEPTAKSLRDALLSGTTLLFAPSAATAEAGSTLGVLLDRPAATLEEVVPRSYAMLSDLDFRHPLLAAFANPKFSDFTKVRIWRHRRFDTNILAGARMIARFDSGDPAWMEFPVGRGRLVVFAAGWHPADSQLALSTKFVPLLVSLLETTSPEAGLSARLHHVGDFIPIPSPPTVASRLILPDGSAQVIQPGTDRLPRSDLPGLYTLEIPGIPEPLRFAVNLDPTESRTIPLPLEDLERHGVALGDPGARTGPTPERAAELAAAEVENRQKLWRWFLVASVAFVFLESTLAGWMTRRSASPSPSPA